MWNTKKIEGLLKRFDLKITQNRISILEQFLDNHEFHTITEVTSHLKDMNIKSVYNNIQKMVEVGILESFSVNGEVYYEIIDHHKHDKHQAHIIADNAIGHMEISQNIFKQIGKEAKKLGKKPQRIKIIIEE